MVENVLQKLIDLFTASGANFHVLEHEAHGGLEVHDCVVHARGPALSEHGEHGLGQVPAGEKVERVLPERLGVRLE